MNSADHLLRKHTDFAPCLTAQTRETMVHKIMALAPLPLLRSVLDFASPQDEAIRPSPLLHVPYYGCPLTPSNHNPGLDAHIKSICMVEGREACERIRCWFCLTIFSFPCKLWGGPRVHKQDCMNSAQYKKDGVIASGKTA
jgi:hypothetical protein